MLAVREDLDRLEREVARRANLIASSGRRSLLGVGQPGDLAPDRAVTVLLSAIAAMDDLLMGWGVQVPGLNNEKHPGVSRLDLNKLKPGVRIKQCYLDENNRPKWITGTIRHVEVVLRVLFDGEEKPVYAWPKEGWTEILGDGHEHAPGNL